MILGEVFERNAAHYGQLPAIYYEDRVVTHAEFLNRAYRLGNALQNLGACKQDRVLILAQNCPEFLELNCACSLTGLISVGLNYRLAAGEQLHIVNDCLPAVWIFEEQYAERVAEICEKLSSVPQLICIGRQNAKDGYDYDELLAQSSCNKPSLRAVEQDIVFLVYTSGTTGHPKGVMQTHAAQIEQAKITSNACAATPIDRVLMVMPFYHAGAPNIYLGYAWAGASVVLLRAFDVSLIYANFSRHRVTAALLAPVMIQMLLDAPEEIRNGPNYLSSIFYSSAPMPVPLLKRGIAQFGSIFAQAYGMTECLVGSFMYKHQHRLDGAPDEVKRLASAGQPYFGCNIVVRRLDGSACEVGEVGEVTINSPAIMHGYWNNMQATLSAIRDGWYFTGDLGYFDKEHYLFVVDRKKDMIISGGENIYSREVEEALLTHPSVFETAVIGIPDEKWGESVMAFVVCRNGKPGANELIEHCRMQIGSYKKPKVIEFVEALPRVASTNKIDKKALRAPYWNLDQRAGI
ncbi:MAG: AMP-dependent synthetase [Candidimonas sp.]|nr:MAG: AMP-dependent synthetase [Candidimonas sp.]TAM25504.1 MAG: AMP-dependent synthetase [Candidimonas sp.]